jgi:hypothetical protein
VALAEQKHQANEIAEGVDKGHDFGGQAATRAAYGLILSPPKSLCGRLWGFYAEMNMIFW